MIKINTEGLKSIIAKSIKCCANNRMLPLTAMVRIEAFKDDEISLTTTNMRDFLKVTYSREGNFDEVSVAGAFDVVVNADKFLKLIQKTTSDYVSLDYDAEHRSLKIIGNGKYVIETMVDEDGPIDYPEKFSRTFGAMHSATLSPEDINVLLTSNRSAVANTVDEACYMGYFIDSDATLTSDRIKICKTPVALFEQPVLFAPTTIDMLELFKESGAKVSVSEKGDLSIVSPDAFSVKLYSTPLEGIEDFAADTINELTDIAFTSFCKLRKNDFINSLERLSIFVGAYDQNEINISFTPEALILSNKSSSGGETLEYTQSEGFEEFSSKIELPMLLSAIKSLSADAVELWYGQPNAVKLVDGDIIQILSLQGEEE